MVMGLSLTTVTTLANRIYLIPFIPQRQIVATSIGLAAVTVSGSKSVRFSIYASGTDGLPTGTALATSATLSFSTGGYKEDGAFSYTFSAGVQYWIGVHGSASFSLRAMQPGSLASLYIANGSTSPIVGFQFDSTFSSGVPTISTPLGERNEAMPIVYIGTIATTTDPNAGGGGGGGISEE